MSDYSERTRSTTTELVVWCIATPILATWALVSFLPIVSLIRAWGDPLDAFLALVFLSTGALGLMAGAIGYRLLLWDTTVAQLATSETRTLRVAGLTAYALVWMAFYAL